MFLIHLLSYNTASHIVYMYIISLAWPRAGIQFHCILSINQTFLSPYPLACIRHTHTHTLSLSGSRTSNACPSATPSVLHCVSFLSGAAVVLFCLFLLSKLTGGPSVCHTRSPSFDPTTDNPWKFKDWEKEACNQHIKWSTVEQYSSNQRKAMYQAFRINPNC